MNVHRCHTYSVKFLTINNDRIFRVIRARTPAAAKAAVAQRYHGRIQVDTIEVERHG